MSLLKEPVKKTGYTDIDELLTTTHNVLQDVDQLQKEIEAVLKHKPSSSRARTSKWRIRFKR